MLLLFSAPCSLLAVWLLLIVVDVPPAGRTILYSSVVIKLLMTQYNQINVWDMNAMEQRTEIPPLGLARQVVIILVEFRVGRKQDFVFSVLY